MRRVILKCSDLFNEIVINVIAHLCEVNKATKSNRETLGLADNERGYREGT